MSEEEQQQEERKDGAKLSSEKRKIKRKKRFLQEVEKADKRGVCYLSHIPPKMDHIKLRQLLSQYGDIQRIYLTPESNFFIFRSVFGFSGNFVSFFKLCWKYFLIVVFLTNLFGRG